MRSKMGEVLKMRKAFGSKLTSSPDVVTSLFEETSPEVEMRLQ
ncbi:MAG: hypothetical protein PHD13_01145 [Methanocellales archaeon]|nr:hypothetical protein [Methanocellales archaeon]MDD3291342.1 hypothetical protein [Methanocellales archaeon]MDD5234768.1 hypothetical protein [Methanocellales archaeon]MDD5484881.1 hypothetical protein [Methanocellales archaeon]